MAAKHYLLAYNLVQFAGWAACLAQLVQCLATSGAAGLSESYAHAGRTAGASAARVRTGDRGLPGG